MMDRPELPEGVSEEAMMLIGGLSAAVEAWNTQATPIGTAELIAFTFAYYRGAESVAVITRDGTLKLAPLAEAAQQFLDGLALKKPTLKDLTPNASVYGDAADAARDRFLKMRPTEAAQQIAFEIIGYIEAMKQYEVSPIAAYDTLVSLIKRLRKADR
jgi:hypothetical protein